MKVFISWSGSQSHQVAVALRDWLPSVLQIVEPYVSSEDIDKGARWSTDISRELEDSSFGIICVTPENVEAPWVNFEAGALSKSLDRSRVAPFLFAVDRTAIQGPLLQFQSTLIEEGDVKKLLLSMDKACNEHSLGESRVSEIFEVWWPHLKERLDKLEQLKPKAKKPNRPVEDVLAEILELSRGQQKLLSNPEQLLPPAYFGWAVRHVSDEAGAAPHIDREVLDDLITRWSQLEQALMEHSLPLPEPVADAFGRMAHLMNVVARTKSPRRRVSPAMRPESD